MASVAVRVYVTAVVAAAVVATTAVRMHTLPASADDWTASAFFGSFVVLAFILRYQRSSANTVGSIAFLPLLAGVLVSPSIAMVAVAGIAIAFSEAMQRRVSIKGLFNTAQYTLATALAALLISTAGSPVDEGASFASILGFIAGATTFIGVNSISVSGAIAIDQRASWIETWKRNTLKTLAYDFLSLPFVFVLAWAYQTIHQLWVFALVLPIFGLRQLYKQNWELESTNEDLLKLMVAAIEARDPYTSGHSRRVARYSEVIARLARISPSRVERIRVAALLHDVGKIFEEFAPLLRKAGPLSAIERGIMETHPVRSAELASNVSKLRDVVPALRSHHERWDGKGYPDRLLGEKIPLGARVIAIADTIDAMTSSRPYRNAMTVSEVRSELARFAGSQFDPDLCRAIESDAAWEVLGSAVRSEGGGGVEDLELTRHEVPVVSGH